MTGPSQPDAPATAKTPPDGPAAQPEAPPASSPGPAPLTSPSAPEAPPAPPAGVTVRVRDFNQRVHAVEVKVGETIKQLADRIGQEFARYHGSFNLAKDGEAAVAHGEEAAKVLADLPADAVLDLVKHIA